MLHVALVFMTLFLTIFFSVLEQRFAYIIYAGLYVNNERETYIDLQKDGILFLEALTLKYKYSTESG